MPYWAGISVFLHPLGLTQVSILSLGLASFSMHLLEDTDRLAWICPYSLSELVGISSLGFLVLSPPWGVVLRVYIIIPGY